jgi:hypothetical protein
VQNCRICVFFYEKITLRYPDLNHAFSISGGGDTEDRVYLKQCTFIARLERQVF